MLFISVDSRKVQKTAYLRYFYVHFQEKEINVKILYAKKYKTPAMLHVARTVARRAERVIITLSKEDKVRENVRKYVNRLSDTLYAMARFEEEKSSDS